MDYKITQHYERGEEQIIAEFKFISEARIFLRKKMSLAAEERIKIIYRLYDNEVLLEELNHDHVSATHADYAEGNRDIEITSFIYHVYLKKENSAQKIVAHFNDQKDAWLFLAALYESDPTYDDDLFLIFKNNVLIETLNKNILNNQSVLSTNKPNTLFSPTPFPTTLTPHGSPSDYWGKKDE